MHNQGSKYTNSDLLVLYAEMEIEILINLV